MSRWVRLQTSVFSHEIFPRETFSQREAWIWLIANAAWKDTTHRVGNTVVEVPAGSLMTTLRNLQKEWGWGSDYRVRSFLNVLENQRMVSLDTNAGKTQITLCNYGQYQNVQRTENASATQAQRTETASATHKRNNNTNTRNTSNTSSFQSDVCLEAANAAPASPTVIELPALQDKLVKITEADVEIWSEAYPAVNVRQQLSAIKAWLINNPKNRKTANGMRRFVNSWLGREQDRGGKVPSGAGPPKPKKSAFQERHENAREQINRALGITDDDKHSDFDNGNIIDLGRANYRG